MTYLGKTQLIAIFIVPPDQVAEGDRIFKSHRAWMEATHYRDGEKALLSYNVSKGPELSNPMDPNSAPTGNMCFLLSEIYESKAGVLDHFKQTSENWEDVQAFGKWLEKCKVTLVPAASIFNSLWP
ncbi:MAG: hypothetical protein JO313_10250 [Verrucomicrobia bacterium]|nr:hypothetical protein [Verrucomicrobiota bacterium]MBV9645265.1 hypothetical protein [Verrucomicrobiota bacterium]